MRMWVHITVVTVWLIYCVPGLYEYIMYTMVSLCSNLLLSVQSMHGPTTFYSKLNVDYITPTHRNDETEYSCHIQNLKIVFGPFRRQLQILHFVTAHSHIVLNSDTWKVKIIVKC